MRTIRLCCSRPTASSIRRASMVRKYLLGRILRGSEFDVAYSGLVKGDGMGRGELVRLREQVDDVVVAVLSLASRVAAALAGPPVRAHRLAPSFWRFPQ